MERSGSELPGFRFHPTEEELLNYYLHHAVNGKKLNFDLIGTLNIYRHDPWDLPKLARIGEREWHFFVPRDRKQGNGRRPNRMTERGFWKATGSDRPIRSAADAKGLIGVKKTLVFYTGRAPRGFKTDWVMTEYRLPNASDSTQPPKEDIVLCKVYRKATSQKELEQRAVMEEIMAPQICLPMIETTSSSNQENFEKPSTSFDADVKEMMDEAQNGVEVLTTNSFETSNFLDHQIPKCSFDWMQDSFSQQLHNLWPEQWSPYTDTLNF